MSEHALFVVLGISAVGVAVCLREILRERDRRVRAAAFDCGVHAERSRARVERRRVACSPEEQIARAQETVCEMPPEEWQIACEEAEWFSQRAAMNETLQRLESLTTLVFDPDEWTAA